MKVINALVSPGIRLLKSGTSFDASGDASQVVGYAAVGIFADAGNKGVHMLNDHQKKELLRIARETLEYHLRGKKLPVLNVSDPVLRGKRGVFVTLREKGQLRGCIGMIVSNEELAAQTRKMAIESATGDPRFAPVTLRELSDIEIEISVLTEPKKVSADEIVLGRDGVIVSRSGRQGVFLPQVADETGWSKEEFLSSLCSHKAGLPDDAWKDPATDLFAFQAQVFSEHGK